MNHDHHTDYDLVIRRILIGTSLTVTAVTALIFSGFIISVQAQTSSEFSVLNPEDCKEKGDKLEVPNGDCEIKEDKDECSDDSD